MIGRCRWTYILALVDRASMLNSMAISYLLGHLVLWVVAGTKDREVLPVWVDSWKVEGEEELRLI
jgi:hypothetical protein